MSVKFLQQQQQSGLRSASVRSLPSPQHGAHMHLRADGQPAARPAEEKSFAPALKR